MIVRRFAMLLVAASVIFLAACGGGGSSNSTVTGVTVTCSPSTITSGGTSQCSATVTGTGSFSTAVSWAASNGSISSSGLFTAPGTNTSLQVTVTATSTQNTSVAGTATVIVNPSTTAANVAPIVVDAGPSGLGSNNASTNVAFATVTVCIPGTNTCQTIDHVSVDTGSSGLRLLSSASGGEFNLNLPPENVSGNPLDECLVFLDGFVWGPVYTATVTVAGETASNVPVQIMIPGSNSPGVPSSCSSQTTGPNEGDTLVAFGANGIIGVGLFQNDCGQYCVQDGSSCDPTNSSAPCVYYQCPGSGCTPTNVAIAQQVPNPVTLFATDNNGVLIQLPSVPDGGSPTVNGSLIFGIGTESNNALGSAQVYVVPDTGNNPGNILTTFNGQQYQAFLDSGSNGLFFLDSSTTGIPTCSGFSGSSSWYCPSTSPDNLTASNQGQNTSGPVGNPVQVNFSIENATNLFNTSNTAFSTLGGPQSGSFDWGLSFFYGRSVFTAIDTMSTPGGTGPYFAY